MNTTHRNRRTRHSILFSELHNEGRPPVVACHVSPGWQEQRETRCCIMADRYLAA